MGLSHMTLEYVGISCRLQWGHGGTDKGGVGSTGQSPTTEIGGSVSYTSSRGFLGCSGGASGAACVPSVSIIAYTVS